MKSSFLCAPWCWQWVIQYFLGTFMWFFIYQMSLYFVLALYMCVASIIGQGKIQQKKMSPGLKTFAIFEILRIFFIIKCVKYITLALFQVGKHFRHFGYSMVFNFVLSFVIYLFFNSTSLLTPTLASGVHNVMHGISY